MSYRDPKPEDLKRPEFEVVWQAIKKWDVNVPDAYNGYCGATGNHVMVILDAIDPILAAAQEEIKEAHADCVRLQQEINCLRMEPCQLPKCVALQHQNQKLREALQEIVDWFDHMRTDHYEKLVHHQTFESASANWDKLLQKPLDITKAKRALEP